MFKNLNILKLKKEYLYLILLGILGNLFIIIIPIFQKKIVSSIVNNAPENKNIYIFLFLSAIAILTSFAETYLLVVLRLKFQKWLSLKLLGSLSVKNNRIISTRGSGAFMSSVFGDSEQISSLFFGTNIFLSLGNLVSAIFILIITYRWARFFPFLIVASYFVIFLVLSLIRRKQLTYFDKARDEIFKLNPIILETIENRQTIMSSFSFSKQLDEVANKIDERDQYFKKSMLYNEFGNGWIDSVKNISLVLFFIFSMFDILSNKMEISSFVALLSYFPALFLPIHVINSLFNAKTKIKVLYNKNQDSFEAKENYLIPIDTNIRLNKVFIQNDDKVVLSDVNIELDKIYGIIGISGEGKSSLLKAILGENKPTGGKIFYGGKEIHEIDSYLRQKLFRYYKQDNDMFNNDLEYNITLGRQGVDEESFSKLRDSIINDLNNLKSSSQFDSDCHSSIDIDFLKNIFNYNEYYNKFDFQDILTKLLSNKEIDLELLANIYMNSQYYILSDYNNLVTEFNIGHLNGRNLGQRGNKVSGGEKNKICLARTLLSNTDLPFLIDEPFTNIDLISERENLKTLKKYISGEKGIIVSHKIELLKLLCDEIIVISNGKIESKGQHNELLKTSTLYRELYNEYLSRK